MKEVDFIVVGCGLAGISFCEQLRAQKHSFIVFDNNSQMSSIAAAGLYNPVILKRFTPVWKIKKQLSIAIPTYVRIEQDLDIKIDYQLRILRRFSSLEEQNTWLAASDKPILEEFMNPIVINKTVEHVDAPFGFGEVLQAGRLDTDVLIVEYLKYLKQKEILYQERLDYSDLKIEGDEVVYKNVKAKHIVFAEGFGMMSNPFFKWLPLNGTKGEVLTVRIPKLDIDFAIKSSVFIIPLGNALYTVGSTYNWEDKSNHPTPEGKEELLSKLRTFITAEIEVVNHVAGIRPTVKDRRPLVGRHPEYKNLYLINGLGTRGVLIGPYVATQLYNFISYGKPLDQEINLNRFS